MKRIGIWLGAIVVVLVALYSGAWWGLATWGVPLALDEANRELRAEGGSLAYQGLEVYGFPGMNIRLSSWQVDMESESEAQATTTFQGKNLAGDFAPWFDLGIVTTDDITIIMGEDRVSIDRAELEILDFNKGGRIHWQGRLSTVAASLMTIPEAMIDLHHDDNFIHEVSVSINRPTLQDLPIQLGLNRVFLRAYNEAGVSFEELESWPRIGETMQVEGGLEGDDGFLDLAGTVMVDDSDFIAGSFSLTGKVSRRWEALLKFGEGKQVSSITSFLLGSVDRDSRIDIAKEIALRDQGLFVDGQKITDLDLRLPPS